MQQVFIRAVHQSTTGFRNEWNYSVYAAQSRHPLTSASPNGLVLFTPQHLRKHTHSIGQWVVLSLFRSGISQCRKKSSNPSDDTQKEGSFYPTVHTGLYAYTAKIVQFLFCLFFTTICFYLLIKTNLSIYRVFASLHKPNQTKPNQTETALKQYVYWQQQVCKKQKAGFQKLWQ